MAGKITAVDRGSHSTKVIAVKDGKGGLAVQRFAVFGAKDAVSGLRQSRIPVKDAVCGLAGRDMTLRYTQVPPAPDWQLQNLMELEIQDMAAQTGGDLSADYNLLPIEDEDGGMETVLLAFARDEALDETGDLIADAGGSVSGYVPNCVALYNCFLRCGPVDEDAVVCLVNLGHATTDIAIVRGVDLLFVRNLQSGGNVFDEAIKNAFNVKDRKAQELKKELLDLSPFSRGRYASGQAEKVTLAAGGAGSMIVSAIQSSIAFCRSQTKVTDLELDKILICGGAAKTRGIEGMLREALHCPVEKFDPFENVDVSGLPDGEREQLERFRAEAVVALGLAASKLDNSLYALEILPEAVKRRRRFAQQTIYNIAAALIAVILLGMTAMTEKKRVEAAEAEHSRVRRIENRAKQLHRATEELVQANAERKQLVDHLAERIVPHDGTLLTLRGLQALMPPECWLQNFRVWRTAPPGASSRADMKPLIRLSGRGKDVLGSGVDLAYREFESRFKALEYGGVKPEVWPSPRTEDGQTVFEWVIDYRPAATAQDQ